MKYERLVCQRETLESCSGRFVWGSERITTPFWGMYFVAAALETISILRALYVSSEITWNYIYHKFRAKWSVSYCICKCIHFHNPSTEAFGRLEYIRITDNAGNEFKAQKIGLCQISKFDRNPKLKSRSLENVLTNSRLIFVHLWPGVCWQGRGLACRAGVVDRIMVPTPP